MKYKKRLAINAYGNQASLASLKSTNLKGVAVLVNLLIEDLERVRE